MSKKRDAILKSLRERRSFSESQMSLAYDNKVKNEMTQRDRNYAKLKDKYDKCLLTRQELDTIPSDKRDQYLDKCLKIKYNKTVSFDCPYCAMSLLYDDGYISDNELYDLSKERLRNKKTN